MKRIVFLTVMPILALAEPAMAQSWRWSDASPRSYGERQRSSYYWGPYWDYRTPPRYAHPYEYRRYYGRDPWERRSYHDERPAFPKLMEGGPRPNIRPIKPERVAFRSSQAPGTVVIDTAGRQLLLVQSGGVALRYPISVGREGFSWTGEEKISRIAEWPDWHPPAEMRERDPRLPVKMTGGIRNPLGAKALYLGNTLYRIHGTNDASSIGRASSSGCFRMLNGHVLDLAERVGVGTKVVVVSSLRNVAAR